MEVSSLRLTPLDTGSLRLDGGAMFGIVPKSMWEKWCPPDPENRILLSMNALLVENQNQKILIDCGAGDKWTSKQVEIFQIHSNPWDEAFCNSITHVICTHLHFDHNAGLSYWNKNQELTSRFPNAIIYLQQSNFENAQNPNPRERASYLKDTWEPLIKNGQLELLNTAPLEFVEILPQIQVARSDGHTLGQQLVLIDNKVLYCGDVIPSRHHVPLSYLMAYDQQPLILLEEKKFFLNEAVEKKWKLFLEHDTEKTNFIEVQSYLRKDNQIDFRCRV